jgi:crotonobetainyl-CoA:carnitine CoA-transferase CaiB-like acyl-CoA transferase
MALEGLRIVDLTQVAAGPYATFLLGFMGAEVIKVESTSRMDNNRGQARPIAGGVASYPRGEPGEQPWNRAVHHVHRNVNKLSITLDLDTERGKQLLLALARKSDALMENFRASVMDRLGLGYHVLSEVAPQLIYLKISSQGATGPESDYGSLGSTLEQTGGLASITGYEGGLPLMTNETYPDPVVGILSVGALMAGLRHRRKTGKGAFIDVAQREATVSLLGEYVLDFSMNGRLPSLIGDRHPFRAPQGCYPCIGDDMWVTISVGSEDEWNGLCRAMRQPALAQDARFAGPLDRRRNHEELDAIIAAWTRELDHYQAMHMLQAHGVPAGAVAKGSEVLNDPHLNARGFWDSLDHPEAGVYKQVSTPWHLSENPEGQPSRRRTWQHNAYVLGEILGLTTEEIVGR